MEKKIDHRSTRRGIFGRMAEIHQQETGETVDALQFGKLWWTSDLPTMRLYDRVAEVMAAEDRERILLRRKAGLPA